MGLMDNNDAFQNFVETEQDDTIGLHEINIEKAEYSAIIQATFEAVDKLTKKEFPEYLWTPMLNNFGEEDDYVGRSVMLERVDAPLRRLRRQYKDYYAYLDAIEIYNAHLDLLVHYFRSESWVRLGISSGIISYPLPIRPTIKMTPAIKQLLLVGAPIQKPSPPDFTDEEVQDIYDHYSPADPSLDEEDDNAYCVDLKRLPKATRKAIKTAYSNQVIGERKNNIYRAKGTNDSSMESISRFMGSLSNYNFDKAGHEDVDRPICEIVAEEHKYDYWADELVEDKLAPRVGSFVGGVLTTPDQKYIGDLYAYLASEGYSITKQMMNKLDPMTIRYMYHKSPNFDGERFSPLNEKQREKLKKRQKKAAKKEAKRKSKQLSAAMEVADILSSGHEIFRGTNGELYSLNDRLYNW